MKEITSVTDAIDLFFEIKQLIVDESDSFVQYLDPKNYITGLWFRGESDFGSSGLTPSVFRQNNGILRESDINNYLPAINSELRSLDNAFDRLCTMQHYDIPTRLLDWSESILTALYFAVSGVSQEIIRDENGKEIKRIDRDGKLFCLNAKKLNDLTSLRQPMRNIHMPNDFGTLFRTFMVNSNFEEEWNYRAEHLEKQRNFNWKDPKLNTKYAKHINIDIEHLRQNKLSPSDKIKLFCSPLAIMPNRIHNRLIFQSGMFTLHGGKIYSKEEKYEHPIPEPITLFHLRNSFGENGESFLKEYVIPNKYKYHIKEQLMNLGIHQGSLFPELDKQNEFCLILK